MPTIRDDILETGAETRVPDSPAVGSGDSRDSVTFSAETSLKHLSSMDFQAFLSDDVSRTTLRQALAMLGRAAESVDVGGISEAIRAFTFDQSPPVLVVDVSGSLDPLHDIDALANVCEPGTEVVALGGVNDVSLFRGLVSAGVRDYLVKPVAAEALAHAISTAQTAIEERTKAALDADAESGDQAKAIAFIGLRGGVGASMIALSTAWTLAEEGRRKVALVDLDPYFGTAALAFDVEGGRGLREVLESPDRIDSLFVERATVKLTDHLYILSAEAALEEQFQEAEDALPALIDALKGSFDCVLVDMPRHLAVSHQNALAGMSDLVLVADPSLACVRDGLRVLNLVKRRAREARIRLILNRPVGTKHDEVTLRDFERTTGHAFDATLPYEPKLTLRAARNSRPVAAVGGRSGLARALDQLSADLVGGTSKDLKRGAAKADGEAGADGKRDLFGWITNVWASSDSK